MHANMRTYVFTFCALGPRQFGSMGNQRLLQHDGRKTSLRANGQGGGGGGAGEPTQSAADAYASSHCKQTPQGQQHKRSREHVTDILKHMIAKGVHQSKRTRTSKPQAQTMTTPLCTGGGGGAKYLQLDDSKRALLRSAPTREASTHEPQQRRASANGAHLPMRAGPDHIQKPMWPPCHANYSQRQPTLGH